ncbi:MAG: hypothetical protein LVQ63_07510 [Thermoplasmatales archaeon]|nr:hypothetical protein [Thermoplasmatales archaeon]
MKLKNHGKAISILVVVIVIVSSTLVVLSQPVTVKSPGPGGDWTVRRNETFVYVDLMFVFPSLNSTHISGTVKSNSSSYLIFLMTPGQIFDWLNESNRSMWNNNAVRGSLNGTSPGGTITTATNITPPSFLNSRGGSGNLQLSWGLSSDTSYVLLFIGSPGTNQVLSINTYLNLSYTYSRI